MRYRYTAIQGGVQNSTPWKIGGESAKVRTVLYGYRTKLDFGEQVRTDERGNALGTFASADDATHLGLSVALLSIIDVGVGGTAKRVNTDLGNLKASTSAYDFGFMVRVPAVRGIEWATGESLSLHQYLHPLIEGVFGAAWQNRGGNKMNYGPTIGSDPLPANRRRGWSGKIGFAWVSENLELELFGVRFAGETYRPQIEGTVTSKISEDSKSGTEISLLETVDFRRGEYEDQDGEIYLDTKGVTIRSDGISKVLAARLGDTSRSPQRDALHFLANHLSIRWSHFDYEDRVLGGSPLGGISHAQIEFAF